MRIVPFVALLLTGISSSALAGDQIGFGPAPAWVQTTKIPDAGTVKDGPAVLPLLFSQHVRVEPGRISVHSDIAMKFLTPEGLAAGTIIVQWRPDKDDINVNRLVVVRDGKEIDLLKAGKKFELLRREANLEQATLDGQITAVMQPDDLRVGDTIILSMTLTSADPVMGRHAEYVSAIANDASAKSLRLRVDWPTGLPLKHRFYELPEPKMSREGNWQSVEWQMAEPAMFVPPKGAPTRFQLGRRVEFTDFANWKELSDLFRPIFDAASVVPAIGSLRDEVEKIRRSSNDPKAQASAALALVEDKVRYVNIVMGQGNYVPANAVDTWQRRYGDCKAKTALLIAILREVGINAEPVLVSSVAGDGMADRLPTITQFDHVIVRARIANRDFWLDATRSGDADIGLLATPSFGWGLPLVANADLVRIQPGPISEPHTDTTIAIDASEGADKPAPTRMERIFRGDSAIIFNAVMAGVPANGRDKGLRDYWKEQYSDFTVSSATGAFDRSRAEYRLIAEGTMKLDLYRGRYEVDVPTPGFKPDFARESGKFQKAPFAVLHPNYTRSVQTIIVPDDVAQLGLSDDEPIDRTLAGRRYQRTISKKGNLFRIETSARSLLPEISYVDALAAEQELRKLDDKDYYVTIARPTKEETQALLDRKSTGVDDYLTKGSSLVMSGRLKEAISEFDQAVSADPKNIEGYEIRGMAKLQINDLAGARADFETAIRLGATRPLIDVVATYEAAEKGDWKTAIASASAVLVKFPDQTHYLMARADLYRRSGDIERAIADTRTVTRLFPNDAGARLMRIQLFQRQHNEAAVIAEADEILKLRLQDPFAYVAAAKAYSAYGRTAQVDRAFEMALKIREYGYIYLNRAETRPKADRDGRKSDIDRALKLEPEDSAALGLMADFLVEQKDYQGALARYDAALKKDPSDLTNRVKRGIANVRLGQTVRADADFAFVRAEAEKDSWQLNNACWAKATAGVALESALLDCDLALKVDGRAAGILDSRGLVLLRLGRIDEAIAAYSAAIAISKDFPSALFGRSLAWERKGDLARAAADAKAATAKSDRVREDYRQMGLVLKTR